MNFSKKTGIETDCHYFEIIRAMMRGCESFVGPGGAWRAHNRKAGGSNPGGREVKFVTFLFISY